MLLAAMMRHARPNRVVEIGAGFSTAMMLDTVERFLDAPVSIEAIDPEPQRLRTLLRPGDERWLTLRVGLVQDMPTVSFTSLQPNDILFIDSSHVMKLGSDVSFLFFEVLPRLAPGVLIHLHDIAWPFEYPVGHYQHGWAWNEAHALRLLLPTVPDTACCCLRTTSCGRIGPTFAPLCRKPFGSRRAFPRTATPPAASGSLSGSGGVRGASPSTAGA